MSGADSARTPGAGRGAGKSSGRATPPAGSGRPERAGGGGAAARSGSGGAGSPGGPGRSGTAARAGRLAAYALLAVLGALAAVAGALVQEGWFPGGLLLALLALAGLAYGGVRATGTRMGGGAPALAWIVAVLLLTTTRPEGDYLLGARAGSYLFLVGGMFCGVMCATFPRLPQPPDAGRAR
ncbi:DUF6113 family protein [Streptomyces sp. B1866]|uniref:DUF6113 family protein n=1 Tax=Streptomyces sp. B1866 TaxID=3075431 RepID=UPI00288D716E|nr:DUF6113 family protein [Streptomyces sp. B1866]MDT3397782.1 DUF6113 family protein [Streptomyces sp. B1866]